MKSTILSAVLLLASLAPALSSSSIPRNQSLVYEVRISQRMRQSTPWTGVLTVTINDQGIVNGRYRSNSIRPDPLRNQIIIVTGGLNGENISLSFGTSGRMSVHGTITEDGITGSFRSGTNQPLDFDALRVTSS